MPLEARTLALAERFHVLPWEVEDAPADRVMRWMAVLGVEGEVLSARAGLPADQEIYFDDDDEWS